MRALRSRQAGMGMLGWLIMLALASFALTCFFKVGPVYLDYWQAKQSLDDILGGNKAATMSKDELRSAITKHFDVSRIDVIKPRDIKITDGSKGREVDASYEKRVPLIYNIDVVVKFDQLKYSLAAGGQ